MNLTKKYEYTRTNAQLNAELTRSLEREVEVYDFVITKGTAEPVRFTDYADAVAYQNEHGGLLTYKLKGFVNEDEIDFGRRAR